MISSAPREDVAVILGAMEEHRSTPESGEMPPEERSDALPSGRASYDSRPSSSASRTHSHEHKRRHRRDRRVVAPSEQSTLNVDRLAPETTERELRAFFMQYGTVLESKVVRSYETGQSRGFGFVRFSNARDADNAAYKANRRTLDGSSIRCSLAKYTEPSSHRSQTSSRYRGCGGESGHSKSPGRWRDRQRSRSRSPYDHPRRSYSNKRSPSRTHQSSRNATRSSSEDHGCGGWSDYGGSSNSSSHDSGVDQHEVVQLRKEVEACREKEIQSQEQIEELQRQLDFKQREIERLKEEHSALRSKMQSLSETHDRRGTLLVKSLTALRHQHELKKQTARADIRVTQMMEDALKMAEEWNQHSDVGLGLDSILKDDIDLMEIMTERQQLEEGSAAANGKGGWKPLSFRLK